MEMQHYLIFIKYNLLPIASTLYILLILNLNMSLKCSECSQLLKSSCYYCCDKKEKYCINCSLHVCKRCKK